MTHDDHRDSPDFKTPGHIRDETFQRRLIGLDADAVYEYLDLLADQVQATERELDQAREQNARIQADLERAQAELDEHERASQRVNDQMVEMFSQAQLVAESMVEEVSQDARERIGQARAHERKIVEAAMDTAGQQVRTYALSAQAQMQSVMESFASEIDRLGSPAAVGDQASAASDANDPLFGDVGEWRIRARKSTGPGSPGSR
jgi:cell division septum initiation protein DivIVA